MITNRIYDNGSTYSIAHRDNVYILISPNYRCIAITPDERRQLVDGEILPHDIINRR